MNPSQRVAVVTGANRGLGLEVCRQLAARGLTVVLTSRDAGQGERHGNPGLAGGAMLANEFIRLPYQFMAQVPPWVPRWGRNTKISSATPTGGPSWSWARCRRCRCSTRGCRWTPRSRTTGAFRWRGCPVRGIRTPSKSAASSPDKAEAWLKEAGAVQTWKRRPPQALSGGQHQAGTAGWATIRRPRWWTAIAGCTTWTTCT